MRIRRLERDGPVRGLDTGLGFAAANADGLLEHVSASLPSPAAMRSVRTDNGRVEAVDVVELRAQATLVTRRIAAQGGLDEGSSECPSTPAVGSAWCC